ncbi:MAG: hypothetical protein NC405_08920 [Odoribacter sp.]|nr:hypothetical protein [Odoribacter sp.]
MKNTQIKINSRRMDIAATLPSTDIPDNGHANDYGQGPIACRNLRPSADGRLVPVEDATMVAETGTGSEPMLTWHHQEQGRCMLLRNGNGLTVVTHIDDADAAETQQMAPLPDTPQCAIESGDGESVIIMTGSAVYRLRTVHDSGLWKIEEAVPEFPAAHAEAVNQSTITADVAEKKMSGTYTSTSRRLMRNDMESLRSDLITAWEEIDTIARSAGRCIAPMLVRYRVKDSSGSTVFMSPVTMIGTEEGYGMENELSTEMDGNSTRKGFTVECNSYQAVLQLPGEASEAASRLGRKIEVEAVGPLHGVDAECTVWNHVDVSANRLRFFMPGMATTMVEDTGRLRDMVLRAAARFDQMCETVASIDNPFAPENLGKKITLSVAGGLERASQSRKRIATASGKPLRQRDPHELKLAGGGWTVAGFTAQAVANNGDTILWGGLRALPHEKWSAAHFATGSDLSKSWTATASTTRKSGTATCNSSGYTIAPTRLSPLMMWPGEDGGTLIVKVKTADGTAIEKIDLTPIAGSGLSGWLTADLRPIILHPDSSNAFTVEASTVEAEAIPGSLAGSASKTPLQVSGMINSPFGEIAGITTATALSSAWDYSRDRFYVLGDRGINMCVTNAAHKPIAVQLIDGREVKSRQDIAIGTADRGVAVIAGGQAVNIKGSKATDFPGMTPVTAKGIGWDGGDLWIMLENGMAQVRPSEAIDHYYTRDTPEIASMMSCGDGRLWIVDKSGRLLDSRHKKSSEKEVEWSYRIEMGGYRPTATRGTVGSVLRITAIGLAMVASAVKARFTATTDSGSTGVELMRLLLSVIISGTMKESLFLPVATGRRHWFTIGLKGTVSPDMKLRGISVHMK